jgi:hypothetical protein
VSSSLSFLVGSSSAAGGIWLLVGEPYACLGEFFAELCVGACLGFLGDGFGFGEGGGGCVGIASELFDSGALAERRGGGCEEGAIERPLADRGG